LTSIEEWCCDACRITGLEHVMDQHGKTRPFG
jgi:hypothetical protein